MSDKPKTGGPAFPRPTTEAADGSPGMTLREYAAIQLRVPNSGTDWLDAMIREAQHDAFAGQAMQGLMADSSIKEDWPWFALSSQNIADAMMAERARTHT